MQDENSNLCQIFEFAYIVKFNVNGFIEMVQVPETWDQSKPSTI